MLVYITHLRSKNFYKNANTNRNTDFKWVLLKNTYVCIYFGTCLINYEVKIQLKYPTFSCRLCTYIFYC